MAQSNPQNRIKALAGLPRGAPLGSTALKEVGVSPALATYYVRNGWLDRLGRGTFKFPNDDLELGSCLRFLAGKTPGLHVGGKTALAWQGVRHNIGSNETVVLWGGKVVALPPWFTQRFHARYVSRTLFISLPESFAFGEVPDARFSGVKVSEPERALLEMLADVGVAQGLEEARNIMEGVRSVRLDVLETLLRQCPRVKVVRLCLNLADELELPWAAEARSLKIRRGRGRWMRKLPDGTTLVLKP